MRKLNANNRHTASRLVMVAFCAGLTAMSTHAASIPAASPLPVVDQQNHVKGTIVDQNGEPLIGATIMIKGTSKGAITDLDGNFSIDARNGQTLVISCVGFKTQEVKAQQGLKVTLAEDAQLVNELVVIGYGTQRKGDVTSSVASVKAEDFTQGKIGDAAELVKGKIAGLSVVNSSGDPLAGSSIMLRGATTLEGSVTPLVLVDGVEGSLSTVAPENIASIDVLKDASAAAIYGTRGANGVIIITTKSGKRGEAMQASYNGYVSFSNWTNKMDFMDTHDIINGLTAQTYMGYDTDWLDGITRKAGFKHNHSVSFSGGSKNAVYSANLTYSEEEGIIRKTGNEQLKAQVDYTQYMWNDKLKMNINMLSTRTRYNTTDAAYAYRQAIIRNPSEPVYNADGSYYENFDKLQYYNPIELQNESFGNVRNRYNQLTGNLTVEPIRGWQTNVMFSFGESTSTSQSFTSPKHYSLARQNNYNGSASKSEGTSQSKTIEITSRYANTFAGKHRVDGLVGYSYLYDEADGFNAGNGNFSTTAYLWNQLGNGTLLTEEDRHAWMGSYKNDSKLVGFFGRVSYGFDDKYNVLVSLRHEGSTKFGDNHKWATFPSVSAGWNITNEKFMEQTKDWLSNLRLRVGYGVTGITPTSSYMSQQLYAFAGYGDIRNEEGNWIKTLEVSQNTNKDLKWETTKEWNIGIDYGFLGDRIHGTIDVYRKTTDDLLYWYAVPVPPNMYGQTLANVGSIRNTGIEFAITALPIKTKDFTWETTVTLSHNSNKLLNLSNDLYETDNFQEIGGLSDPISVSTHCMEVGHRLGDFWGLKFVGYDKDGFALVETKNADGTWGVSQFNTNLNVKENRQRLGSGMPQVYFGWNHTLRYAGFDLSAQFTGQFGYKILNAQRCFYENNSIAYNRLKSAGEFVPAINTDGTPVLNEDGSQLTVRRSSSMPQGFWSEHLEKGDFLKLSSLTLGYTLPLKGAITQYISKARIYASATNLFCITGYDGIDPEVSNYYMAPGIDDRDKYPTTRSYTIGLSLNF